VFYSCFRSVIVLILKKLLEQKLNLGAFMFWMVLSRAELIMEEYQP